MAASAMARKIQDPTPWVRKKSGMPKRVKVLNSVAAKVSMPTITPSLEPAMM